MSDATSSEDKNKLISLSEAADMYGFNSEYLRQLAKKGRLSAFKIGRNWITTSENMENYIKSRKKRGKYRKIVESNN